MHIPPTCLTCGCPIGDVGTLYRHLRIKRIKEALAARGTTATQAAIDAGLQIDCGDILERLGIPEERDCCRGCLVTTVSFEDLY